MGSCSYTKDLTSFVQQSEEEISLTIDIILGLLGGLALFLYGMQMTSSGLEAAAGNRMKSILEQLTTNRFMGVLVGAVITAVIQSSSATTVMVVGFVNAGMMTLNQAVWIIMGANIGTTIPGILVSLDMGAIAPLFAFIGVSAIVFVKKQKVQHVGQILAGLGVLFIGMDMMSAAMYPLRDSAEFVDLVSNFSNPIIGILGGAGFTGLIQSSAAAIGIVQSLANAGVIPFASAAFVLFGTNIGTCITAVLASIGTNRNARRATLIHLMFNVIGTVLFTTIVLTLPITALIESLVPSAMGQIAAMHTSFNIGTTILLLPLGNYLAKLAMKILPDQPEPEEEESGMHLEHLRPITAIGRDGGLGVSAIVIDQMRHELNRMLDFARHNVDEGFSALLNRDLEALEVIGQREDYIDYLNKEISRYVSHLISIETNEAGSAVVSSYFTISGNIERIGDHADNLAGYTKMLVRKDFGFSEEAREEIRQMQKLSNKAMTSLYNHRAGEGDVEWLSEVAQLEQQIDDMTESCRRNQIARMRAGVCNEEACIIYSEMLTDFERIGDHVLNIAEELTKAHAGL